jgi:hypothetical protein
MSKMEKQVEGLREIVFKMLNFTNMYCLVLDHEMIVKFVNLSLALDLGYESYEDMIGHCWLDFIKKEEKQMITIIHHAVSTGKKDWEEKYREVQNTVITREGREFPVYWFNSHINTELDWTFSFGIKKIEADKEDDIREFYFDILKRDRVIINSMRDSLGLRDKIVDTCKPTFVNDGRISFG